MIQTDNENYRQILSKIFDRSEKAVEQIDKTVDEVLKAIQEKGDQALIQYTAAFDQVAIENIKVTEGEIEEAMEKVEPDFLQILEKAKANIWDYHMKQKQNTWLVNKDESIILGQMITPIERIGIYVPGGKAAYPSTVLMNAIPAQVAGVSSIAMVTPPGKDGKVNPYILAAAKICGLKEIYKVGGAQAVGALAYGTQTIRPVHKIVGPGNIYVARAKKKVYGMVDIDMIAGPSEICVIADQGADPRYIAADLLSQAEHDERACSILITTSSELANQVSEEVDRQMKALDRTEVMQASIDGYGNIFVVPDLQTAVQLSNEIAPEHLELMVREPFVWLPRIKNAGAIFLGDYAPEPLGDYFAGPNHTLPTSGTAKFSSPLGVDDFIKKSSIIYYGREALEKVKDDITYFAEKEGLTAHANSIKVRFSSCKNS